MGYGRQERKKAGSWGSKRVRHRRNRGKLHNNVLYFAIEKERRKKEEAKTGTGAENVRYSRFCFNLHPLPPPPPPH